MSDFIVSSGSSTVLGASDVAYINGFAASFKVTVKDGVTTLLNKSNGTSYAFTAASGAKLAFLNGAATVNAKGKFSAKVKDLNAALNSQESFNVVAPAAFTLTTGIDEWTGSKANETVNATDVGGATVLTALDSLDGGLGNDTLNITTVGALTLPASATVAGFETVNIRGGNTATANVSGWTGLTQLNVTSAATGAQTITAAATTGIKVANSTAFGVTVVGGGKTAVISTGAAAVKVGENTNPAAGDANAYTSVAVKGGSTVAVTDNSGAVGVVGKTLTTVTLDGNTGVATLTGDAIANVTVANSNQNVTITNVTADHATSVTINKLTAGIISDTTAKTLTVTATGAASSGITTTADLATSITFAGDKAISTALGAVQAPNLSITSTNSAGTTITTALDTDVSFTGGAGDDVITIGATTKTINMGAGNNTVNVGATIGSGGSVVGGSGSTDVLSISAANAATATATTTAAADLAGKVSGFERLVIGDTGATAEVKLNNLDAIQYVSVGDVATGQTLTLSGVLSGFRLNADSGTTGTGAVAVSLATDGTSDVLNLGISSTTAKTLQALTANGFETVNITSDDTATTPAGGFLNAAVMTATAAKTIVVTGDAGFNLGYTGTTATSIDASGISKGGFTWTAGALAASSTVKGSATGTNTITLNAATTATTAVTYTGGTGNDVVASTNNNNNVFNLGDGANSINTGAAAGNGNNTVTGGKDVDTIKLGNGNNTINTLAGNDVIIVGSGNNSINAGDGDDSVTVGAGLSVVTGGAGVDTLVIGAKSTNGNTYATFADATVGDKINLTALTTLARADAALGAKVTLADTASFTDYLNASSTGDGATAAAIVKWFQFGGNTYVVVDDSAGATFATGADSVVKLSGLVDLSTSTTATDVLTIVAV